MQVYQARKRYDKFLLEVLKSKQVWALVAPNNKCSSVNSNKSETKRVTPFWSNSAEAQKCVRGNWVDRSPKPIQLDWFMEHFLIQDHKNGWAVGCNWDCYLRGLEVEPLQLLDDLSSAWTDRIRIQVAALRGSLQLDPEDETIQAD